MSVDASLGDLAHATLVISLGYLALNPFRYRETMEQICQKAVSMAKGMPDKYKTDKAWVDLKALTPTASLRWLFRWSVDRTVALVSGLAAGSILATRMVADGLGMIDHTPEAPLIANPSLLMLILLWTVIFLLIFGMMAPLVLVYQGRRSTAKVKTIVTKNLQHLASRYKEDNAALPNELLDYIEKLQEDDPRI